MNIENTCCETHIADKAIANQADTPVRLVLPVWNASKTEKGVELQINLPGVRKEHLNLEVRASHLHLQATRATSDHTARLVHGPAAPDGYRLKLRLGESLDGSALNASLADGVLRVFIPLAEDARPKKIEIL